VAWLSCFPAFAEHLREAMIEHLHHARLAKASP
jgi:hypothetical protein